MKYKAIVFKTHKGLCCRLYRKFWLFWICIDLGYVPLTNATFLIDESLKRWEDFFGDKLIIEDCRKK